MTKRAAVWFVSVVGVGLWASSVMAQPALQSPTPANASVGAPPSSGVTSAVPARDSELPPEPSPRRRRKQGLALKIAGGAMLGAGYVGSAASYALNSGALSPALLIPVAGPWVALGSTDWNDQVNGDLNKAVVVVQGLLQGTGLLLLLVGLVKGSRSSAQAPGKLRMTAVPGPRGASAGIAGIF